MLSTADPNQQSPRNRHVTHGRARPHRLARCHRLRKAQPRRNRHGPLQAPDQPQAARAHDPLRSRQHRLRTGHMPQAARAHDPLSTRCAATSNGGSAPSCARARPTQKPSAPSAPSSQAPSCARARPTQPGEVALAVLVLNPMICTATPASPPLNRVDQRLCCLHLPPCPMPRSTASRNAWRSMPANLAASARVMPPSPAAIACIRAAAARSGSRRARRRGSAALRSPRIASRLPPIKPTPTRSGCNSTRAPRAAPNHIRIRFWAR